MRQHPERYPKDKREEYLVIRPYEKIMKERRTGDESHHQPEDREAREQRGDEKEVIADMRQRTLPPIVP